MGSVSADVSGGSHRKGSHDSYKRHMQLPVGFLPSQPTPTISPTHLPDMPTIALVDTAAHESLGPIAKIKLEEYIGHDQVFDIANTPPETVVQRMYDHLESLKTNDIKGAIEMQTQLRVLLMGDHKRVYRTLQAFLRSPSLPEVSLAIAPLGTSNDISRSVGWGSFKEDYWSNTAYVPNMLKTVGLGRPVSVDCWSLRVASDKSKSLIAGLPESFIDSPSGSTGKASLAWNSVYVALDSEAAHGFARLAGPRARRADRPPPQSSSSGVKRMFNCFCGAPANAMQPQLQIQTSTGSWRTVTLPSGLSAIMIENLPKRWANGDDFWDKDREGAEQTPAAYNDKMVEVYGLTQGALHQGWNVRSVENHTKRLGQGGGVRLYVQAPESNHSLYVLMDGEDWWQRVPAGRSDNITKDGLLFELTHHGQTRILANASPHGSAAVSKPSKATSTSVSGGVKTSGKLRADTPPGDAVVDAADTSPDLAVGAAAAAAGVAATGYAGKSSGDYDMPDADGSAQVDLPTPGAVQLDTPGGSGVPTALPDADVSASMPGAEVDTPDIDADGVEVSAALPGAAIAAEPPKKKSMFSFLHKGSAEGAPSAGFDADSAAVDAEGSAPGADIEAGTASGAAGALPSVDIGGHDTSIDVPDVHASDVRGPDLVIPGGDVSAPDAQFDGGDISAPDLGAPSPGVHGPDMTIPTFEGGDVGMDVDASLPSADVKAPDVDMSAPEMPATLPPAGDVGGTSLGAGLAAGAAGMAGALGAAGAYAIGSGKSDDDKHNVEVDGPAVDVDMPDVDADGVSASLDKPKKGFFGGLFGRKKTDADVSASLPAMDVAAPVVDAELPSADVSAPDLSLKAPEVELPAPSAEVTGVAFPLEGPGLAAALTSADVSAPGISLDTPVVDVSLPTVSGPDVDASLPSADVSAPGFSFQAPDVDASLPSADTSAPGISLEAPDVDTSLPSADVSAPEVDMKVSAPEGMDAGALGAGVAAGAAGLAGALGAAGVLSGDSPDVNVKVDTPDADLDVPKVDVDVPSVDVAAPAVDVDAPSVDVDAPSVDIEGASASLKPKKGFLKGIFGRKKTDVDASASLPGVSAGVDVPDVDASLPSAGVSMPDADVDMPAVDASLPTVDVDMSAPDMDASLPSADVSSPQVDMKVSAPEGMDAGALGAGVAAGAAGLAGALGAAGALSEDSPDVNVKVDSPDADLDVPSIDVAAPAVDVDAPAVDVDAPSIDMEGASASLKPKKGFLKGIFSRKKTDVDASASLPGVLSVVILCHVRAPDVHCLT
eukprot:jgi/Ulvmu1/10971/UM007_0150.1